MRPPGGVQTSSSRTAAKSSAAAALLANPAATASGLLAAACTRINPAQLVEYDPATLALELRDEFAVSIPGANLDRLAAALEILGTDHFQASLPRFCALAVTLAGEPAPAPGEVALPEAAEAAVAMVEATLIDPEGGPYADEIRAYIAERLKEEGLVDPPAILAEVAARVPTASEFPDDPDLTRQIRTVARRRRVAILERVADHLLQIADQLERLAGDGAEGAEGAAGRIRSYARSLGAGPDGG